MVASPLDATDAGRFAALALACVPKEYPNKIAHVLNSPADVKPPLEQTPAFYGCYDWHSAVHGHWLLAARAHADSGLAAVTGEHYEGGHWLGSFATYLVTGRGKARAN